MCGGRTAINAKTLEARHARTCVLCVFVCRIVSVPIALSRFQSNSFAFLRQLLMCFEARYTERCFDVLSRFSSDICLATMDATGVIFVTSPRNVFPSNCGNPYSKKSTSTHSSPVISAASIRSEWGRP